MGKPSDLVQGTLDLLILKTISLEPLHGWAIAKRIEQVSGEVLQVQQGSLYPALHRLEQQIAENIAAGMNSEEAGYAARRAFGNTMLLGEQARDTWSWTTLELLLQNLRIGIRTLARTPGFAFVSILVIAIGIGANVA